ncbi:MAG: Crp/Fnr family transcriptional regulator [Magnetospirillum sp.]|nr:Crp/Fnr family transcriptional regulator [Magnetospirillum sp.]
MSSEVQGAMKRSRLFAVLPGADSHILLDGHRLLRLAENAEVFTEGAPAEALYLIVSGELVLIPTGSATPLPLRLQPGDTAGEEAVLTRSPHGATARTIGPATLLEIRADTLLAYLESHFEVAIAMISYLAANLRDQVKEITELKMQSTAERLASYLLSLAGDTDGAAIVRLPYEKRLLADHLGMDPATLSRAFAKLRDKGVVASRTDKVEIANVAELRIYGDCAAFPA